MENNNGPGQGSCSFIPGGTINLQVTGPGRQRITIRCGEYGTITCYIRRDDPCIIRNGTLPTVISIITDDQGDIPLDIAPPPN